MPPGLRSLLRDCGSVPKREPFRFLYTAVLQIEISRCGGPISADWDPPNILSSRVFLDSHADLSRESASTPIRRQAKEALRRIGKWTVEIVKRSDVAKGFVVLPRRWVVERTLAWLSRNRCPAKDLNRRSHRLSRGCS